MTQHEGCNPLVSIITVVFNSLENFEETIISLLNQSYENIEYIVIDGGSTDGTVQLIKKYENHINYWISEKDNGIYDALNKGLDVAKGEIIGILNSGDLYHKSTVEKVVNNFKNKENIIFYGNTILINGNDVVGKNEKEFNDNRLLRGFGFLHTSCFVPKIVYDKIGRFSTIYEIAGDTDFLLRCYKNDVKFFKINTVNYMRAGGISEKRAFKAHKEYMKQLEKYKIFKKNQIRKYSILYILGIFYLKLRRNVIFRKALIQIKLLVIHFINITHRLLPFHFIKKTFLRLFGVKLGRNTYLHNGLKLFAIGKLKVGSNTVINRNVYLDNRREIEIGNNVSIAHDCKIYSLGHDINSPFFETKGEKVVVDDNAVLFSSVMVMPGVKIGKGSIVLSGSVVTKDVPEFQVYGGNPATFIKNRNNQICYKLSYGFWKAF